MRLLFALSHIPDRTNSRRSGLVMDDKTTIRIRADGKLATGKMLVSNLEPCRLAVQLDDARLDCVVAANFKAMRVATGAQGQWQR